MIRKATRAAYHFDPISLESTISIGHGHGWLPSLAKYFLNQSLCGPTNSHGGREYHIRHHWPKMKDPCFQEYASLFVEG